MYLRGYAILLNCLKDKTMAWQDLPATRAAVALFLLASIVVVSPVAVADDSSNFAIVKLPRGIELQIPKGWWLLELIITG